jgi:hypothetical protein
MKWWTLMIVGALLGSSQLIRALFIDMPPLIKTVQKLMLGAGIALFTMGIMEMEISVILRILLFSGIAFVFGIVGAFLRIGYIRKTCRKCSYEEQWEVCDGLSFLYSDR